MKKVIMIVVLLLIVGVVGCNKNDGVAIEENNPLLFNNKEVLQNVYDDQQSTAYIKADSLDDNREGSPIAEIMARKKEWEKKFPAKKIVAMSIVTSERVYTHSIPVGLLIHYEQR